MQLGIILLFVFYCAAVTEQKSSPLDDHYWAGVVEFSSKEKWDKVDTPEFNTAKNLIKYKEIINSKEANSVDIMVFPEATLNSVETASFIPAAEDNIAPCNNLQYEPFVQEFSCLARSRQMYLVVNLVEKALCPENGDWRPCANDGLYHFNSNVVFNRDGIVIARYRKFNLFGEPEKNTTISAELVHFTTDFGVTFGTFICFDLMFEQPALQLVREGITDFVFPTMWFSELPFLTSVQIQQAWAFKNNVNFLAAGASYPEVGSTGTGIYAGKRGRIVSAINHNADVKLYVAQVPKLDKPQAILSRQPIVKYTPTEMTNLKLKRDQLDSYTTSILPMQTSDNYTATLCHNLLCCNFTLDYTVTVPAANQQYYQYMLAVHDGKRTFDGFANGMITACTIFACTSSELETCATRFDNTSSLVEAVRFNSIAISGLFPADEDVFLLPNNVDTSILPFEVDEIEYSEEPASENGQLFTHVQYRLLRPRSDLYTFAIWGRKFVHETSGAPAQIVSTLLVLITIFCNVIN